MRDKSRVVQECLYKTITVSEAPISFKQSNPSFSGAWVPIPNREVGSGPAVFEQPYAVFAVGLELGAQGGGSIEPLFVADAGHE